MRKLIWINAMKQILLRLIQTKRGFKSLKRQSSFPFRLYGFAFLVLFVFYFYVKRSDKNIVEHVRKNAFNPKFTGAKVCGSFSCFGRNLCDMKSSSLVLLNESLITGTKSWINVPGVLKGKYRTTHNVVLNFPNVAHCNKISCNMKLSQETFSRTNYQNWICHNYGYKSGCNAIEILHDWPQMNLFLQDKGRLDPIIIRGLSPPLQCASSRLADRLVRRILGSQGKGSTSLSDYSYREKAELIFTCKMSPETVMEKLFPKYEGWLFHESLGACGLMTMRKFSVRTTIFELHDAPWKIRLDVAVQLLDMARFFTENDSKFLLLIHRLTPHDLGLSKSGKLRIENSENIVVVDTDDPDQDFSSQYHETPYHKENFHVPEETICSHRRTDINYYTVCRYFLSGSWKRSNGKIVSGGLLHHSREPQGFTRKMLVLLDLCVRGSLALSKEEVMPNFPVREAAAGRLRLLLASARECNEEYAYRYPECELMDPLELQYRLPNLEIKRMV